MAAAMPSAMKQVGLEVQAPLTSEYPLAIQT
ncbi:hypothetical protein FHS40_007017 [Streptomyces spectabilis]|uniref:Uncharacterized protein n=1 Tax=Streptomyces spectabilis TaxID=68270 RepID=A0A7W8B056_STRST|nr:hypothetical protein [Streptomyces spectabilis]